MGVLFEEHAFLLSAIVVVLSGIPALSLYSATSRIIIIARRCPLLLSPLLRISPSIHFLENYLPTPQQLSTSAALSLYITNSRRPLVLAAVHKAHHLLLLRLLLRLLLLLLQRLHVVPPSLPLTLPLARHLPPTNTSTPLPSHCLSLSLCL